MLSPKISDKHKSIYGYTLIELILSLSLTSILLSILFMMNSGFFEDFNFYYKNVSSDENADYAIAKITNELKRCNDINGVTVINNKLNIRVNNVIEDFYYDSVNKCIKSYSSTGGSEIAYNIDGFFVTMSEKTVEISIKSNNKLLSSIVTLRYNGSDDFEN